ncbi:MAG TPA: hypothetical protein RMG45_04455, partial [Polyangiaceae bacterium LLY-WYZ-15_(1-7)]|nr:hypothetical protein [Polyangiaceae bacterium LLY-WYZ-15_(1-7)]
ASGKARQGRCGELSIEPLVPPQDRRSAHPGELGDLPPPLPEGVAGAERAMPFSVPLGVAPSAGSWILAYYLFLFWSLHLLLHGRPPEAKEQEGDEDEEEAEDDAPPPDPLAKLGEAVRARQPEARLEALERVEGRPERTATLPPHTGPVIRELIAELTGGDALWSHQREVLDHLLEGWTLQAAEARGATPTLVEEAMRERRARDDGPPHALVLAPEGSGRTTLALLATLHVHFDRGASTLALLPDRRSARAWAERLREALLRSAARWNVQVCVAGDDLSAAFLAGKTPAVVVADPETFEAEVLSDPRSDDFVDRLGLVVVDDLDALTGVVEMHVHMAMRRLWALTDTRRRRSGGGEPLVLLALAGPAHGLGGAAAGPSAGVESWARHVLAAPLKVFEGDGAPRAHRVLLRRRDLVDGTGDDIPLHVLAEACDAAGIRWHMRTAGDGLRGLRRAEIDLGRLRRHHTDDPREAEVVLLEGLFPDVRREAERLAHAGVDTETGTGVLVLAPPADEEMVLHEEADDAPHAALTASLPRSVTLSEPDVLRQRHFDRALGREHDVEALRARFGRGFVDEALARLRESGRIREREVWYFDRRKDDAAPRTLVRSVREAALGEPIQRDCVSDSSARVRVIDQGTSEELLVVDAAVAPTRYPPGRVFLHPRGRYQVVGFAEGSGDDAGGRTLIADHVTERCRTTIDAVLELALPAGSEERFSARQLGGEKTRVAVLRAEVREKVLGVRRYGPGPELLEQRRYEKAVEGRYWTDVCLVSTALEARHGEAREAPSREALVPLAAGLRMMVPCALRGAAELVGVDVVEVGGVPHLAFWDRTPGASGFAEVVAREGLKDLLRLARLALERLVGRELVRLRRLHDTSVDGDAFPWDFRGALRFLDRALDPPPSEGASARKPTVEHVPGEGPGDLGRLWLSRSGRSDDLVWTRHRWVSAEGPRHLDVAVERRAILEARAAAGEAGVSEERARVREAAAWRAAHAGLLAGREGWEVARLRRRLAEIEGGAASVLRMVAAIPTRAGAMAPLERAPLAVLMRRRADVDAKALLAWALLDDVSVLVGEAGIAVQWDGGVWDLSESTPREVVAEGLEVALG